MGREDERRKVKAEIELLKSDESSEETQAAKERSKLRADPTIARRNWRTNHE
jgi:hypothetical protein